jgi:SAM-dependent methyltransferase
VLEVGGITGQDPAVYEGEYVFWPWTRVVDEAVSWIEANAPQEAAIVDYMCGTGYLLHKARAARPDLRCFGCDLDPAFIAYGRDHYPDVDLAVGSALEYEPPAQTDVIVCTGGLHHLPRDSRAGFVAKCGDELASAGAVLIGEEVIAGYDGTASRRSAVLQLYSAILEYVIGADAPPDILSSVATAMRKEFTEDGTSKDSLADMIHLLQESLTIESLDQTWPGGACQFGDYLAVCRRREDGSQTQGAR